MDSEDVTAYQVFSSSEELVVQDGGFPSDPELWEMIWLLGFCFCFVLGFFFCLFFVFLLCVFVFSNLKILKCV